jgi:serine/threonine protein kinase
MAPEVIQEKPNVTSACDIWSLGCTVIELLTGKPPYFELNFFAAMTSIVKDDHPPIPEEFSKELRDFLILCFQKEPEKRIDAIGLLTHPWLNKNKVDIKELEKVFGEHLPTEFKKNIMNALDPDVALQQILEENELAFEEIQNEEIHDTMKDDNFQFDSFGNP